MRSAMRVTCCLWLVAICSGVPACRDTDGHSKDMNGGAAVASKDMNGDGCADYKHPNHCKEPFDDDDFSSSSMCCLCGGGTSAAPEETIVSLPPEGAAPTASPEASVPLSSAEVEQVESRNFVGPNGQPAEHVGEAPVRPQQADGGHVSMRTQVMGVTILSTRL